MPEDLTATVLPLDVYIVSDTLADPITDPFREELQQIFTRAGITIRIDGIERLTGTPLSHITDFNEPQESPTSQSAMIPSLVAVVPTTASTSSSSNDCPTVSLDSRSERQGRRFAAAITSASSSAVTILRSSSLA